LTSASARNSYLTGRICKLDLLTKKARFVQKEKRVIRYKKQLISTSKCEEVNCTVPILPLQLVFLGFCLVEFVNTESNKNWIIPKCPNGATWANSTGEYPIKLFTAAIYNFS
jgi:hypothetical protein